MAAVRPARAATVVLAVATLACLIARPVQAWIDADDRTDVTVTAASVVTVAAVAGTDRLYPGGTVPVRLSVSNPNSFPVRVTAVAAGTSSAAGACPAGAVTTAAWAGIATLAAGASTTLTVAASMATTAPQACAATQLQIPMTVAAAP